MQIPTFPLLIEEADLDEAEMFNLQVFAEDHGFDQHDRNRVHLWREADGVASANWSGREFDLSNGLVVT